MFNRNRIFQLFINVGIVLLQFIMTQITTLLFSFFLPGMEDFPQRYPALFVVILGIMYSTGIYLIGWLAIHWRWLQIKPLVRARLIGTVIGAYLPLLLALLIYPSLEAGNPFFFIAILTGLVGFYLPGWIKGKTTSDVINIPDNPE